MYKLLLVDDEILVREAIRKNMKWNELGFDLAGDCEDGRDAIRFLKKNPVDLVITDICMPYIDGLGICKYLYENSPQTAIIVFSGFGDFSYAKQAIRYNVSEYLLKPVTAAELKEALSRVREKLDAEQEKQQKIDSLVRTGKNYNRNRARILSGALSALVHGTKQTKESLEELSEMGVEISGSVFRVAAADIDIYSEFCDPSPEEKKDRALMGFAVQNIGNEIMESFHAGQTFLDADNRIYLLFSAGKENNPAEVKNTNENASRMQKAETEAVKNAARMQQTGTEESFRKTSLDICREIQRQVHDVLGLSISVGIGKCVRSADRLEISCAEAVNALKYRYTKGLEQIFDAEEKLCCGDPEKLNIDYQDITLAIRRGDVKMLDEAFEHIAHWMHSGYLEKNTAAAHLHRIIRVVGETAKSADVQLSSPDELYAAVLAARRYEDALARISRYAREALDQAGEGRLSDRDQQIKLAMDYLQKNYGNPKLCLADVCAFLNMSTSRFSRIFKEGTGKTFTEVLIDIRMEKAKQLLRESSLKTYEIAEKVGFGDPHYFSTAFKKMTGMTPKEYAKNRD